MLYDVLMHELLAYRMPTTKVIEDPVYIGFAPDAGEPMRNSDRTYKIDRLKLLETLKTNRSRHAEIYKEAIKGYQERCAEVLKGCFDQALTIVRDELKATVDLQPIHNLQKPQHALATYDTVIATLKYIEDDTFEITEAEMLQWVQDKWSWQRDFLEKNAGYSGTARELWALNTG